MTETKYPKSQQNTLQQFEQLQKNIIKYADKEDEDGHYHIQLKDDIKLFASVCDIGMYRFTDPLIIFNPFFIYSPDLSMKILINDYSVTGMIKELKELGDYDYLLEGVEID